MTGSGEGFSINESSFDGFDIDTVADISGTVAYITGIETNNGDVRLTATHGNIDINQNITLGTGEPQTRGDLALVAPAGSVSQAAGTISGDQLYVEATGYSFSHLDIRLIPGVPDALETGLTETANLIQDFLLTDPDMQTYVPGFMRIDTTDPENIQRVIPTVGDLMAVDVDIFDFGGIFTDIQRKLSDIDDANKDTHPFLPTPVDPKDLRIL
jgi:hypothetical protein